MSLLSRITQYGDQQREEQEQKKREQEARLASDLQGIQEAVAKLKDAPLNYKAVNPWAQLDPSKLRSRADLERERIRFFDGLDPFASLKTETIILAPGEKLVSYAVETETGEIEIKSWP